LDGIRKVLDDWDFWGNFWRRGVHVNTPKIGSRGGRNCLGEFLEIYAVLRRECFWGNSDLGFLKVLFGCPRGACEEGGPLVLLRVCFGGILRVWGWFFWGYCIIMGVGGFCIFRSGIRGELFIYCKR
jgi:hypothetical protein